MMLTGSVSEETCRGYLSAEEIHVHCLIPIGVPDGWPHRRERKPLSELLLREGALIA